MADGSTKTTEQVTDINAMLKSGSAFRFISEFAQSKAYKEGEGDDEQMFVEMLASSDSEDLVGDVMTKSALQDMQKTAVGTIMLRDHNPSIEKMFGSIVESKLIEEDGKTCLWIKAWVDGNDDQNVRIWKSISKGVRLGASVTVLVQKTANKSSKGGGLIITNVKLLEISIVSIPCNQDAWTLAASASKALRRAKAAASSEDTTMKTEPVAEKSVFPRTTAMIERIKAYLALDDEAKKSAEVPEVPVIKGMFQDKIEHLSFWTLVDILNDVRWCLSWQKYVAEESGETDFTEIVTAWDEALAEFHAAALDSFTFWENLDTNEDESVSLSLEEAEAIQKSFEELAGIAPKLEGENLAKLMEIGTQMLGVAKTAGIPIPVEKAEEAVPATKPESEKGAEGEEAAAAIDIEKSAPYLEMKERAEKAEEALAAKSTELEQAQKDLGEAQEERNIAKAGLEAANEAIAAHLRAPLRGNSSTAATSS